MKSAVITPSGRIYDRETITAYLEVKGNDRDPFDRTPLTLDLLREYKEFSSLLSQYENPIAKVVERTKTLTKDTLKAGKVSIKFVGSLFHKKQVINQNGEVVTLKGMKFI